MSENTESVRLERCDSDYAIAALGVTIRRVVLRKDPWWEAERNGTVCLFERLDDARYFFAGLAQIDTSEDDK